MRPDDVRSLSQLVQHGLLPSSFEQQQMIQAKKLSTSIINDGLNSSEAEEELSNLVSPLAIQSSDPAGQINTSNITATDNSKKSVNSSRSLNDDLIPQSDPCYRSLKLRNRSVDLLQLVTARTILRFVLSLMQGEAFAQFSQKDAPKRFSIIKSVQNNQECLARTSRSETQLIIGQCLLNTRNEIVQNFETRLRNNDLNDFGNASQEDPIESLKTELDEQNVSNRVQDQIAHLISNEFETYSYRNDLEDYVSPSISGSPLYSIDLVQISKLMNFYGQVFSWDKFFDLIFTTSTPPPNE